MIKEFEKALIETYVPYLVPQLRDIKFSSDEESFYQDNKILKYPSVRVFRDDSKPSFCERYELVDDDTKERVWCWPYEQPYQIAIYCEKQTEAIQIRDELRRRQWRQAYVKFELDGEPCHIGTRLLELTITSDRDNYNEKGAKRIVNALIWTKLVLCDNETVPEIKEVVVRVRAGVPQVKVYYQQRTLITRIKEGVDRLVRRK